MAKCIATVDEKGKKNGLAIRVNNESAAKAVASGKFKYVDKETWKKDGRERP